MWMWVVLGCSRLGFPSLDSPAPADLARGGHTADSGTTADTGRPAAPWGERTLYYLRLRSCMAADGTGADLASNCVTDDDCVAPDVCRHRSEAAPPPAPETLLPPYAHPPAPTGVSVDRHVRFVPVCEDGSGDHEWSLDPQSGTPPTCPEEEWVRCANGTRPSYISDPANVASTNWLVYAGQGGFSLFPEVPAWITVHSESGSFSNGSPINLPRPPQTGVLGPVATDFADWHRIEIQKCTPDRWQGRSVVQQTSEAVLCSTFNLPCTGTLEPPLHDPNTEFDVYLHGDRIVRATLADLAGPTTLYADHAQGTVADTLPALADADRVLFTCHSNGCNGLHHTFDARADQVTTYAPNAEVLAVFNMFFAASMEGEHSVTAAAGSVIAGRSVYDHTVPATSISGQPMFDLTYTSGAQRQTLDWYEAELDASCAADHSADPSPCYDAMHVLANHLNHRFLTYFGQRDRVVLTSDMIGGPYCQSDVAMWFEPCRFGPVELAWQQLVRKQAADIFNLGTTDRCEAFMGPAPYDQMGLWAPDVDSHGGWNSDGGYTRTLVVAGGTTWEAGAAFHAWATTPGQQIQCVQNSALVDATATNAALGLSRCPP